ncbi:MAG: Lrp/AsnC family transcriptional regulator [Crocinitomicaceae bacterium]|nr:Lrp/AsnC family transcriptional regulator [Crocinitomicaceae bacterium]MDG1659343.1 Lrp/AsnC family transcriptional regulator [Crocinitomicaceae bacterium]MDG2440281.1 Lrp/AsnC family transcriptional regulator [Crocinitomicaceae bacterium]|tara:strand:- start:1252 stop:1698 length:447 start_codon:yes stop_codon:yes gene_type:complete
MSIKLDSTDKIILRLLSEDGKLGTKEIAHEIGLTVTPTYERIKRLERNGVIKGYRAMLNRTLIGKELQVHCHISLKDHDTSLIQQFEKQIVSLEEVSGCFNIAGDYDYTLYVEVEDMNAYHSFLRSTLASIPNISNVESAFVMKVMKE